MSSRYMTNAELIERLLKLPLDAVVGIGHTWYNGGDYSGEPLDAIGIRHNSVAISLFPTRYLQYIEHEMAGETILP